MKRSNVTCGKRKKVESLMKECEIGGVFRWGPYTQVIASCQKNGKLIEGYGQARRGPDDGENPDVGESVARYRAVTSIFYKLKKKYPYHPLMG